MNATQPFTWRPVAHPLTLVLRRRWTFGHDPRGERRLCLVSPRGSVYEVRHNKDGTFARKFVEFFN